MNALSYSNCEICGKQIHGDNGNNFTTCEDCGAKVCSNCSKNGFCLEHYIESSDEKKQKIKSNYLFYKVFGVLIPSLILLVIFIFGSLNQNGTVATPDDVITIGFGIFILIYVGIFILIYSKNVFILRKKPLKNIAGSLS